MTQQCGRHLVQLSTKEIQWIDKLAQAIYSEENEDNSTILVMDLASNKMVKDGDIIKVFEAKQEWETMTDLLLETVAHDIRLKTKKLFQLQSKLWIAR